MGKPGWSLTPEQRRKLARHLLKHYRQLKKADYDVEIPEPLKNIAESTVIVKDNEEIIANVFDKLIEKGIISFDIPEDTKEKIYEEDEVKHEIINIDNETSEYILSKFAKELTSVFGERVISNELLSTISVTYQAWKENAVKENVFNVVKEVIYGSNETKSMFANLLGIENIDGVIGIIDGIVNGLNSEDLGSKLNAIERIKSIAIVGGYDRLDTEDVEYDFDDAEELAYLINDTFLSILYIIENAGEFKSYLKGETTPTNQEQPTQSQPENTQQNTQQPPVPENQPIPPEQQTPSYSEQPTQPNENTMEKINEDKEIDEEEEMYKEKLEKITEIIRNNIEVDEEITLDNIEEVIDKLVVAVISLTEKNEELEDKLSKIELENYKEEKKKELVKEGISPSTVENAFEKAKSIEDVDVICDIILKSASKVDTSNIKRKGTVNVEGGDNGVKDDKFMKIFNRI